MENLKFEVATKGHVQAIARIRVTSRIDLIEKLGPGPWGGNSGGSGLSERISLADPVELKRKTVYMALQGDLPVGTVAVGTFLPAFWKKTYWADPKGSALGVFDLVVNPPDQGKGVGRFLMTCVELLAKEHDFSFVRLDAFANNPNSVGFYRKLGYDDRGEIDVRGCRLRLFEKATKT